jgi:sulfofructose kinase
MSCIKPRIASIKIVDRFQQADTRKEVLVWEKQSGGPVATALVTLSRLGFPGRSYGATGDDREGAAISQPRIER